ncbi:MAG: hypothetical protein HYV93_09565 [Candidatus Rokubacteria bacterium]|nr:hypothetical protein [Candidatus Rokubacteria bacterium]
MGGERFKRLFALGLLAVLVGFAPPAFAGPTVDPGWDLFTTTPVTTFGGVPFVGAPLGSFDFGSGPMPTGTTDTIVERLDQATVGSATIPTELVALHLMSAVPVDFGLGLDVYFITLQGERGGPASVGRMTISGLAAEGNPHGTFDSFFDVFFDVRKGATSGPIALSDTLRLTSTGTPWDHEPPPGALEITGVNTFLNGTDREADFWPIGAVQEQHPSGAIHTVVLTPRLPVPGPGGLVLLGLGLLAVAGYRGRRQTPHS